MNNKLMVIDGDLISSLKRQGRKSEAREILQTYYADLKKCKNNALSDFKKQNQMIKRAKGICLQAGCKNKATGIKPLKRFCKKHREYMIKYKQDHR